MRTTQSTITATGSGSGVTHTLDLTGPDAEALVAVGGTFTSCTFTIEGKPIGGTLWVPLSILNRKTLVRSSGSESAANSTATAWEVDVRGMQSLRVYESASGTPTSVTVEIVSGQRRDFGDGNSLVQVVNASATSFGAGISLTGATGANSITLTDNLANAAEFKEGSNSYLKFTTTDSGETITVTPLLTLVAGLSLTGSTGANPISLTDNLADALNIKESSNSYLKFTTTNSAERVTLGKLLALSINATPVAATGAGGGVGGAAAVSLNSITLISSDGATKGVKLNTGIAGDLAIILNTSSTAANLFAASGGTINGGSANAGCAIAASKGVICICTAADTWTIHDMTARAGAAA